MARSRTGLILIGCVAMFLILQMGTPWLAKDLDLTLSCLITTAAMLAAAFAFQRTFFRKGITDAADALGFRRTNVPALVIALALALIMLLFFPVFSGITGIPLSIRPEWAWTLVGTIALNGIAEEVLFRGFVFGEFRRTGISFNRAGTYSLLIFAGVHLFLFLQNTVVVSILGILVAVAIAFPLAFLFERGNRSIWSPALLHVATHSIKLVETEESKFMMVVTAWMAFQIAVPFLVFAFKKWLPIEAAPQVTSQDLPAS